MNIIENASEWASSAAKYIGISISAEAIMETDIVKNIYKTLTEAFDMVLGLLQKEVKKFVLKLQ